MTSKGFYGHPLPGVHPHELKGKLFVIEGGDGAGRSTQVSLLRDDIERRGFPTIDTGLKRSELVGQELSNAMEGNTLCPRTMGLFYATDFADRLEHVIIPALRAGFVVIADRYIFTLMAREIVRGAQPSWIRGVYGIALIPDLIFYLKVSPRHLAERSLKSQGMLNFWESGMDIQRSGDMHQCFIYYQNRLAQQFMQMKDEYGFHVINGNRSVEAIHQEIGRIVAPVLKPQAAKLPERTPRTEGAPS